MDVDTFNIFEGDCFKLLREKSFSDQFDLTFMDPPFNQNKEYRYYNDKVSEKEYWKMMTEVCTKINENTSAGGAIYFMQREKNAEKVLTSLSKSGWYLQNLEKENFSSTLQ